MSLLLLHQLTFTCGDAISFAVEETSNLGQIAVSFDGVLNGGRFHEKGVIAITFAHSLYSIGGLVHKDMLSGLHKVPHAFVVGNV